jgi:hypothetical protein
MEAWAWLAAYLIGFALLQLVLYRYFQRGESTHDATHDGEAREPGYKRLEGAATSSNVDTGDDETVVCQECGTVNARDGMFSYCHECAQPLR